MAINLIPRKIKDAREQSFWKQTSLWGAVAFLVGVGAVSMGILVFRFSLQRELSRLEEEIEAERQQIRAQQDIELKLRDFERRADATVEILDERLYYSLLLERLTELLPEAVSFSRLQVNSPELAGLSGKAASYIDLARFIGAVQNDQEMMEGVQLRSVNLDSQTGQVAFQLDLKVKKESLLYGAK